MAMELLLSETGQHETFVVSVPVFDNSDLVQNFFELRAKVFVRHLKWDGLSEMGTAEIDEYDNANSVYVLVRSKKTGNVEAGVRLNGTSEEYYSSALAQHPTSYMIRDAYLGRLEGIPKSICNEEPPQGPTIVEATRLVSNEPGLYRNVIFSAIDYLNGTPVERCLFLTHPTFRLIGRRLGLNAVPLGPVHGKGKRQIQAFSYDLECE